MRKLGERGAVEAGTIISGLIALIIVYSLASTIVITSENAALEVENQMPSDTAPASIFRLGPLFWALVGIGVAASIVIGAMRVKG